MTNEEIKAKIAENRKKAQERNEKPFFALAIVNMNLYKELSYVYHTL